MSKKSTIFLHLPAYREPELIPTIKDALNQAKYPKRLHFGICRQYEPSDGFDDLTEYKDNPKVPLRLKKLPLTNKEIRKNIFISSYANLG